jgi:hypothetical protein
MRQCSSTNERGLLILRRYYSSSTKKSLEQAIIKQTDYLNLAIENLAKLVFKGDDTSLEILSMMLMNGKMLGSDFSSTSTFAIERRWQTAIYGSLVSHTWRATGITPVILDTGANCTDKGVGVGRYISSKLAEVGRGCGDGNLYYLVDPKGYPKSHDAGQWRDNSFREPIGLSTIVGKYWGNLTVQDMVTSAVTFSKKHGNRKSPGDHTTNDSFSDTWDELWNVITSGRNMAAASGVIGKCLRCVLTRVGS